ncbi:MAG: hypothetical protein EBR22_02550, partial [Cytophagia bacterium]|nr:hypothetical protein [Cytophagia bacterium]
AAHSLWLYVIKALVPTGLSAFYPYPPELGQGLPVVYTVAALGVLLLLGFLVYSRRWTKDYFMGMGFFGITIVLVLQIVTVGNATLRSLYWIVFCVRENLGVIQESLGPWKSSCLERGSHPCYCHNGPVGLSKGGSLER